jgi:endonuclease I/V8-like Glu-specific endopeptidase
LTRTLLRDSATGARLHRRIEVRREIVITNKQIEDTEMRFAARTAERNETIEKIKNKRPLAEVDSPERLRLRVDRLRKNLTAAQTFAPAELVRTPAAAPPADEQSVEDILRERIMGSSDLLAVNYLSLGNAAARSICRVRIRNDQKRVVGFGTGFMISPRLVMTNNHVLSNIDEARNSQIEFNFQDDDEHRPMQPVVFDLDADGFFVTHEHLDYSVVAVRDNNSAPRLASFGRLRMFQEEGKIMLGEPASIIQHPNGEAKQLALRENKIVDRLEEFLHYMTDTSPGSSGSAVFNDEWEVIALHHSGVPRRNGQGQILAIGGAAWTAEMGESKIDWEANEGVRVSRIVADLKTRNLTQAQSQMLAEVLGPVPAGPNEAGVGPVAPGPAGPLPPIGGGVPPVVTDPGTGTATWTIPLTVSVQLGQPALGAGAVSVSSTGPGAPPAAPPAVSADNPELRDALATLREALSKKYFDAEKDAAARDEYYQGLDKTQSADAMFDALHELLESTHTNPHNYKPSKFVYPSVDLQPNGKIRSVYSAEEFEPEELIREDIRIEQERAARVSELVERRERLGGEAFLEAVDLLEAQLPFNCEHVVCQSWFDKKEPMRGDVHHLFACESRCNSFRNNIPYFDFPDFGEAVRGDCGRADGGQQFEPNAGKGKVARSTLYFLLRYPGLINSVFANYDEDSVRTLLKWHDDFPVDAHELHRNATIHALQGNRNPLIDFPKLAKKVDFTRGL